jgi:beta-glucanase (GH16 family)
MYRFRDGLSRRICIGIIGASASLVLLVGPAGQTTPHVSSQRFAQQTIKEDVIGPDKFGTPTAFRYSSGSVNTSGNFSFSHGRVDMRAKIPYGPGMWPVLWLLGDGCARNTPGCQWPRVGAEEIDLVELGKTSVRHTVHTYYAGQSQADKAECRVETSGLNVTSMQLYSLIWEPLDEQTVELKWLINGNEVCKKQVQSATLLRSPMYLYVNTAVGVVARPRYEDVPAYRETLVDYIRVYQRS